MIEHAVGESFFASLSILFIGSILDITYNRDSYLFLRRTELIAHLSLSGPFVI